MASKLSSLLVGIALACAIAFPAFATQRTGACGDKFVAPSVSSLALSPTDDGTLISPANATGPADGWAAASLPTSLPSMASLSGAPWTVCGTSDSNKAVVFTAPLLAVPAVPVLSQTAGGSLSARTYFVAVTYTNLTGETTVSAEATLAVGANNRLVVAGPASSGNGTGWNLYVGTLTGNKSEQNVAPLVLGVNFTEPLGGLIGGASPPTANTASSAYILDGGRVLNRYLVGGTNYQTATLSTDGSNYRVVTASDETRMIAGATTGFPARYGYPGGPGYQTTEGDNGTAITSGATSGGLTVTLPSTTNIATGWTVRLDRDAGKDLTVNVNGSSGGSIAFPGGSTTSLLLAPYNRESVLLQYDGAVFRALQISTATATILGVSGDLGHVKNLAGLKLIKGTPDSSIFRDGFLSADDGGGAKYNWSTTNCAAADDGAQVQPTAITGCWIADTSPATFDPRVYGAVCDPTVDSTAAIQSAANSATIKGGQVVITCPMRIDGSVELKDSVRLHGIGPIFFRGMLDTAPDGSHADTIWPPSKGPALNCTNAAAGQCLLVTGIGVEIDHINFGNPQPLPPVNLMDGIHTSTYTPINYPFIIKTSAPANWNGLHIHHLSFTSTSNCIDLEGTPNYLTSGIAGAQWTIEDIWGNPCLNTFLREARIDNTGRVSNIDLDYWWFRDYNSVNQYVENNSIGFDLCYAANTQFNNVEFFLNKSAIQFTNCTVTGGFGNTSAGVQLQFNNIDFNLTCQAVSIPNGNGTVITANITNVVAFQDNSWCNGSTAYQTSAFVPVFFDFASDNTNIKMSDIDGGAVQTFSAIGHGGGGNLVISGINIGPYSRFGAGAPAFRISAGAHFSLVATDFSAIVPFTGAGALEGPGLDATQDFMQPLFIGSGTKCAEGGVAITGGGTGGTGGTDSGSVDFFPCTGAVPSVRNGYIGSSNSNGLNVAADVGSVFIYPNAVAGGSPPPKMIVGSSGSTLLININNLPVSCSGLATGTIWDNAGTLKVC